MTLKNWQLVGLAAAAKLATEALGLEGIEVNPLFSGLVAATILLLGGTLADYKESERLPGDLASSLESSADECEILYVDKAAVPAPECLTSIGGLVSSVLAWLNRRTSSRDVLDRICGLNGALHQPQERIAAELREPGREVAAAG